jgi:hypothetical protein
MIRVAFQNLFIHDPVDSELSILLEGSVTPLK